MFWFKQTIPPFRCGPLLGHGPTYGFRRSRDDASRSIRLARIVAGISVLLLAAFLVAAWAMTAKPT